MPDDAVIGRCPHLRDHEIEILHEVRPGGIDQSGEVHLQPELVGQRHVFVKQRCAMSKLIRRHVSQNRSDDCPIRKCRYQTRCVGDDRWPGRSGGVSTRRNEAGGTHPKQGHRLSSADSRASILTHLTSCQARVGTILFGGPPHAAEEIGTWNDTLAPRLAAGRRAPRLSRRPSETRH